MAISAREGDGWRVPAFLLWVVFFLIGLLPEPVFVALRHIGSVHAGDALVNSPYAISLAFSAYLGVFCFSRCSRHGLSWYASQDRALQLVIIALMAFLPIDPMTLLLAYKSPQISNVVAVYLAAGLKVGGWWYLLSLFFRYYLLGVDDVFARIPSIFPSSTKHPDEKVESAPPDQSGTLAKPEAGTGEGVDTH